MVFFSTILSFISFHTQIITIVILSVVIVTFNPIIISQYPMIQIKSLLANIQSFRLIH